MMIFPLEQLPYYQHWAFREKFLSPEECDRVLGLLNAHPLQDVALRREDAPTPAPDLRKSRAALLPFMKDAEWLYQRMAGAALECNKSLYNLHLSGILEGLQIDQYPVGGFFDWHQDFGFRESSLRKLSIIIQLTDPAQYEGGDLEFFTGRAPQKAVRTRGALMIFPSFISYRITPVTSGTRHALAGWVSGPPFR